MNYEPGAQVAAVNTALNDTEIAAQLGKGNVVVVLGRANLAESSDFTAQAYNAIAAALPGATVLPVLRRGIFVVQQLPVLLREIMLAAFLLQQAKDTLSASFCLVQTRYLTFQILTWHDEH